MKVVNYEMDVKGHILSAQCSLFDTVFQLINVYAPSGNSGKKDREDLFQNDLLYFARKNLKNLILLSISDPMSHRFFGITLKL